MTASAPSSIAARTKPARGRCDCAANRLADYRRQMTDEQAERSFERIYRADSSCSRACGAGAGLGPSIVQSLVTAHHGPGALTTGPGQGVTFCILLPPVTDARPT
ncbi:ATP-binding protein [Streptomyces sp. NPDC002676]